MTDPTRLDADALSHAMADRSLSAVEVMEAHLDRIETVNPQINAIVSLRPRDELLAEARQADQAPRKGWLHGMPVAVKDLAAVKGIRTTWGSPIFRDHVPPADDVVVARMRDAGAIFIGKTNTPEWGLGSHSFNEVFGATRNPYDPDRSAGGSSGGAAAALAARMVPVADGSDMMGSLRNPAGFCNVYGFRPSWGLVPGEPAGESFMSSLATLGPMARSPRDLAHLLSIMAGPHSSLPFSRPGGDFAATLDAPVKGTRIGWLGDWGGAYPCEDGILPLCETALEKLREIGCEIVPLSPPFPAERLWQSWMTLRAFLNAGAKRALYEDPAKRALLKPEAVWEIEQGLNLSAAEVYEASAIRSQWYRRAARIFEQVDTIALPSAQFWPFPVEWRWPETVGDKPADTYHRWMEIVVPVSLAGLPCLSVPVGFGANGLPMGMQLAGGAGSDAAILHLGQAWHEATGWTDHLPPGL
ncbi:amidase [Paracoccus saliphilus]|uniref:Amidase n=1 Tax=Paracoccus saliphilus TaxID=405559 RepID=A0AA45W3R4_9RHOB|nr:amidase [Paracoccus saliphilus]WCR04342.1 amidase [Paracoccus saliphilus]SIS79383.1 amidase [Paracoccus saliphilus]